MINEYPELEPLRQKIEKFVKTECEQRLGVKFIKNVVFAKDPNPEGMGSTHAVNGELNIRLEPLNIQRNIEDQEIDYEDALKAVAIHECFHACFPELDEKEAFKRLDAGDPSEYTRIEKLTWDYVIKYFPELEKVAETFKTFYDK